MQNDFKDSVKARLWDFKYTPFLSSYVFAWLYWNSKLILIFTSPKLDVTKKIEMLSWNDINYDYPLYFALFYVFIFPLASAVFYATTLGYKALMNKIQQLIQDRTPMPQERANKIIRENTRLELEHRDIVDKLEKVKQDYKQKENKLEELYVEKEKNLQNKIDKAVKEQGKELNSKLNKAYADITDKNTELDNIREEYRQKEKSFTTLYTTNEKDLRNQIKTLNNKIGKKDEEIKYLKQEKSDLALQLENWNSPNSRFDNLMKKANGRIQSSNKDEGLHEFNQEHIKVLAVFYNYDSRISKEQVKEFAKKDFGLSKTITELRISELPKLISIDGSYYQLSLTGKKLIDNLFN